ncbi:lipoyl domain-containing protein [Sphingomonas immobilis]|uniref:Lipoyl domain-containing protein n=1 Tax=Sphingomonas immobilis TaxID=3063997 RepID=A0ABT8ZYA0_9SPHN|nr:lipoyl domain-containing protein [Sphingomonas sp. CA1-15]MDO7842177.1 lipoyl domain-containing protein [Sphingomonas sp. CA1-15]
MAYDILVPQLSFSMTEGTIVEWLAEDGAAVTEGAPLFSIEADKSTVEVPAPASGTLSITSELNEAYAVGTVIGSIA